MYSVPQRWRLPCASLTPPQPAAAVPPCDSLPSRSSALRFFSNLFTLARFTSFTLF
ncbi:hypothetical protein TSUD_23370 [Trifolium subterraneum]|uniref:Uncharacterized protein n=1 Tax=Trifolium subterraneum TaxID=3900 RepID=A0A2Z6ML17_TRISU|nr:hypothetical protein TSUD_23370 [Trifolium subterraneum]